MAKRYRKGQPNLRTLPAQPESVEEQPFEEEGEDGERRPMTLLEATEAMGMQIRGICQRTKLSEQTVLTLFSFQFQQVERARQEEMIAQSQGQAAVDKIAEEQAQRREADEVITADSQEEDE